MPIATNERHGMRRKQNYLTNEEVELLRKFREQTGMSYKKIAEKFEIGKSTARDIIKFKTRKYEYEEPTAS